MTSNARPSSDTARSAPASALPIHIDIEAQASPPGGTDNATIRTTATGASRGPSQDAKRRRNRTRAARTYCPQGRGKAWQPGQEPGIDPNAPQGAQSIAKDERLHQECSITVVDFAQNNIEMSSLQNEDLASFLEEPKEDWVGCRWINVNGLSWDVIRDIGIHHKFHKLAIEDMMNTKNRTKTDWYTDHTYVVLPLQKLVHRHPEWDCDSDCSDDESSQGESKVPKNKKPFISRLLNPRKKPMQVVPEHHLKKSLPHENIRTLQQYQGGPNVERTKYMEAHSALTSKNLAVSVEQVSIFLTSDNTVVSFFEHSAEDIEQPIIARLTTVETILRRCSDASLILQAIIDAIIDLAIPVTIAYQDAIDELELNVITSPHIKHTSSLYILTSELSHFRSNIFPITNLVNSLKDHKAEIISTTPGLSGLPPQKQKSSNVTISHVTHTYLGDVLDHCMLITENLDLMKNSADNLIDLIFNTISAYQNESMKQLTLITFLFLPLSFLTGYFGMNFTTMPVLANTDTVFWIIAVPVSVAVSLWLMRDRLERYVTKHSQRRKIGKARKKRLAGEQAGRRDERERSRRLEVDMKGGGGGGGDGEG